VGYDFKKIEEETKKSKHIIYLRYPTLNRVMTAIEISINRVLVILSFILLFVILDFEKQSIINAISLTILLSLLCIYYSHGMEYLVRFWKIIILW
jgi:hypothetical protein